MNVLNMDQDTIVLSFSIAVLSAPIMGALIGGLFTTKYLGSYTNNKALGLCFLVYCLFVAFCIPCPMVDNYWAFLTLVWFAVFMQGFIEPIMMGIILNTVTPIERPSASSMLILIEFMLGLLPAPYLYGVALDLFPGKNSRAGMYLTFYSSAVGGVCLFFALLLKKRSMRKASERMRKKLQEANPEMEPQVVASFVESEAADENHHN
jgi:MFS family permease